MRTDLFIQVRTDLFIVRTRTYLISPPISLIATRGGMKRKHALTSHFTLHKLINSVYSTNMSRHRNYVFTLNNYTPEQVEFLKNNFKYVVFGYERAPTTNTPHLQGFVHFHNAKTLNAVRGILEGAHVEPAKTIKEAIDYCKKGGEFHEHGTPPTEPKERGRRGGKAEKRTWDRALELARKDRIDEVEARIQIGHIRSLEHIQRTTMGKKRLKETSHKHLWFFGPTGSGKSHAARRMQEPDDVYLKHCGNDWWDGYKEQAVVIIDEVGPANAKMGEAFKMWADKWPFQAQFKGSMRVIRPARIIVTSNYLPEHIWPDPAVLEPLRRRFEIIQFGGETAPYVAPFILQGEDLKVSEEIVLPTPESSDSEDVINLVSSDEEKDDDVYSQAMETWGNADKIEEEDAVYFSETQESDGEDI